MASELINLRDHMLKVLSDAQTKFREQYAACSDWIAAEQEAMLTEVNRQLATRSKSTITLTELVKAEQLAIGHSDYSSKFALYCAEIILGTHKGIP